MEGVETDTGDRKEVDPVTELESKGAFQ